MSPSSNTHETLKTYYGKILGGSKDLKISACCCTDTSMPIEI
ncbi:MAG: hypothetical protein Q7U02_12880 [Desulfosalsimonadaceae bacterium]|nr:hypothetical protein [Desulfosalsimonadaceae bacterium]